MKKVQWTQSYSKDLTAFPIFLQVTRVAIECSAEKCSEYIARISGYRPEQLIFVDESLVDCRTLYRGFAWSFQETQAQRKAFLVHGRWYALFLPLYGKPQMSVKIFSPSSPFIEWYYSL
jgi:hypothetical protein